MKRTLAAVVLLAALGLLTKLAFKTADPRPDLATLRSDPAQGAVAAAAADAPTIEAQLVSQFPQDAELVARVARAYRQNALAIAATDGVRGLTLLDSLGVEAIYLYEKHPSDFGRLRETLGDASAAEILLRWRDYFGLKRADDADRHQVIAEIARLGVSERRVAARYPNALPLLLTDPAGVTELVERWSGEPSDLGDALTLLTLISLEPGAADLRAALRVLDERGPLALDAFRMVGLDGFALVKLYGPVLDAVGRSLPLDQVLILLRVNAPFVDELLQSHSAETVAAHLRHVAAAGLVDKVGGHPEALRLVVEFGERGEQALQRAGPEAAGVVFEDFDDATLRTQAVAALADSGAMALVMLDKYAGDPDFRAILRAHGAAVIPPIARSDSAPEALALLKAKPRWTWTETLAHTVLNLSGDNGQATIRLIRKDGLARVAELESTDVGFAQFLPLYDLLHLANVARRGQSPTTGEVSWALIDGCFVVADVLSLAAIQPEGVAASEAARSSVRTAARQAARRGLAEGVDGAADASARAARWWAVRAAGGTFSLLRRVPEALPRLTVGEVADLGRSLCTRAGVRVSTWGPLRFLKDGREVLLRIPPGRGLKYLALQGVQASVGVVGFQKMEEHLASRRSSQPRP